MSKAKASAHLLQLVDSDSEDGIGGSSVKTTITKSTMPPKKGKAGRKATNKVTKPAPKTAATGRRASDRITAAVDEVITGKKPSNTKGPGRGRKRGAAAAEEVEEAEEEDSVMTEAPAPAQKGARGRPKKAAVEAEPQPTGARRGRKQAVKADEPDTTTEEVSEIPETQQQDATQSDLDNEDGGLEDSPISRTPERAKAGRGSVSKRPLHTVSPDKGDAALRRRLGEMTQKYESLEHRYRDLREVAVREAETNFDKLKKQSEEKSKAADQLIATLKAELSATKGTAKTIQQLKKQLEESEAKANGLQTKFTELTTSLTESKSEIKSLNLKLAAARSGEAAANAAAKVPGSAMKGSTGASRLAAANASEATLAAQKKENLYGDLTGLIVRSVKREGGEDVFDCIQTGRNGTLHFKLAVEILPEEGEAHCHYTPQLDPNRDRALIAVLPGYLVDEISFPQSQAGKFYARVLKALSESPEE